MKDSIGENIMILLKKDIRRDYTIPDVMTATGVKNREKVVIAVARLEERNLVEISREKGRSKYYRLK